MSGVRKARKARKPPAKKIGMPPPRLPSLEVGAGETLALRIVGPAKVFGWRLLQLPGGSVHIEMSKPPSPFDVTAKRGRS